MRIDAVLSSLAEYGLAERARELARLAARADAAEAVVDDYWHLVYSADRGNANERFLVLLDPPFGEVAAVEAHAPSVSQPARLQLLGTDGEPVRELEVDSWSRRLVEDPANVAFLRGDVTGDGNRDAADALFLLEFLFGPGTAPSCADAADANDDGTVSIADAVKIVTHLFAGGGPLPAPDEVCGHDETPDGLSCVAFEACD